VVSKSKDDQTPLTLDFMTGRDCLWNMKSEYTNVRADKKSIAGSCALAEFSETHRRGRKIENQNNSY
jgi:hypothetical protein